MPPVGLGRAVGCILDNAIRAAGPGGRVTVEVREDSGHVHVVVRTTGPGLGKVARAHLDGADHHRGPGVGQRRRVHVDARGPGAARRGRWPASSCRASARERWRHEAGRLRRPPPAGRRPHHGAHDEGHEVVATPVRPGEAVDAVREHQPDACLLDVSFPDASGLSAIGLIHAASPTTKIIILSGSTDQTVVAEAIGKGAHGFVSKERPVTEIIAALERARDGHMAVDSDLLQQVQSSRESTDNPLWVLRFLTDREWEVMRCILDGQTTEEMARNLGVQRSTARTHVQNLLTKLGVHSRLQVAALMNAGGVPNGRTRAPGLNPHAAHRQHARSDPFG